MAAAPADGVKAKSLEELQVYQRSLELAMAVTAILRRSGFEQDLRLRDQVRDASDSVVANIAEGFMQAADRAFARYLFIARGSAGELHARIHLAHQRAYITSEDLRHTLDLVGHVLRMLTALIKYLRHANRRDRGLGRHTER